MCPVSGAQCPYNFWRTIEAVPRFGLFDQFDDANWQILHNTLFAKHKRTLRAAVHFSVMPTPATAQVVVKLDAAIERVTCSTLCNTQNRMQTQRRFAAQCGPYVQIARGAVQSAIHNTIYVRKCLNKKLALLFWCVRLKLNHVSYNNEKQRKIRLKSDI